MAEDLGETWRVLEFYSGIGGMRYSLKKAGVNAKVVEAFDINDTANDVYEHNFGHRPYQGNIQSLTAADLDSYDAHAWLLSPPCQPYTRQGLQKHSSDARAFSFLKMLELIPHTAKPPIMLFVENVVGFEKSDTHAQMIEILAKSDFITQEFILSPLQFGVPYSRPRYFCLAKKRHLMFRCHHFNNQLLWFVTPLFENNENAMLSEQDQSHPPYDKLLDSCEPIETFLEHETSIENVPVEDDSLPADSMCNDVQTTKIAGGNECSFSSLDQYAVPKRLIERWGKAMGILVFLFTFIDAGYYMLSCLLLYVSFLEKFLTELDIVYPDSKRCCCFTKSYYRYVKGTGSLLAKVQMKGQEKTTSEEPCLRYFTPREVANLHSFPEDFRFPQHIGLRQRYALLGNSLSIAVVAPLLRYLFSHPS